MGDGLITRRGLGGGGGSGDLSNYYTKTQTDSLLAGKVDKVAGKELVNVLFGDWSPTIGWYKHLGSGTGYEYGDRGSGQDSEYIVREGSFFYINDLCYISFSIKIRFTSLLGSGYYIALGNLPDAGWSGNRNTTHGLTITTLSKIPTSGSGHLWTPTAGVVGRVVPNDYFALITKENGYIDIPWSEAEDTTNIFYLEGSGFYLRNNGVSSLGIGNTPTLSSAASTAQVEEES